MEYLAAWAREYLQRGWQPVPIPAGSKGPVAFNWQHLRVMPETVMSEFLGAGNIGLLLGSPSGHLVDVDLDCPEAKELADQFLPPTPAVTGRASSPRSHRWYVCPGIETVRHRDPVTKASLVELRGTGCQTLVGPSIHPSGERYDFLETEPALVRPSELRAAVESLACEIIRSRHGNDLQVARAVQETSRASLVGATSDHLVILRRASAYLGAMPAAVSGQGGHNATYAAAVALVHGFGLSQEEAMQLLLSKYNVRCQPPWSERELQHKVRDAAIRPHGKPFGWLLGPE